MCPMQLDVPVAPAELLYSSITRAAEIERHGDVRHFDIYADAKRFKFQCGAIASVTQTKGKIENCADTLI